MGTRGSGFSQAELAIGAVKRAVIMAGMAALLAGHAAGVASAAEPPEKTLALASVALPGMSGLVIEDPVTAMGGSLIPMAEQGADPSSPPGERDLVAVPLSEAVWLFAAGLIGFVLLSNRRSA